MKHFRQWLTPSRIYIGIILAITVYLSLQGLGNHCFWDDEAHVGIFAKNFLKTGDFSGWDGRNLYMYRNGTVLDTELRSINPPLEYLITAASFLIFGVSTWAGRFPFVIIGIASLFILWLLLREDFPQRQPLQFYALILTGFSYSFLLNIRQCRYYALCIFFGVASYYLYRKCMQNRQLRWFLLLAASLVCMFFSNYLLCASLIAGIAAVFLVFHAKALSKNDWRNIGLAVLVFALATIPYAIRHRIWERPDTPSEQVSLFVKTPILLYQYLRELDLTGYIPGFLLIAGVVLILIYRNKERFPRHMYQWAFFIAVYALALSVLSIEPAGWRGWNGGLAYIRFLVVLIPFCAGVMASVLYIIHNSRFGAVISASLLAMMVCTNVLTFGMPRLGFRLLLPAYVAEIHTRFDSPYDAVVRFLRDNASQDDIVYALPEYTLNSIHFYLGDVLKIHGILRHPVALPQESLKSINAPLFIDDTAPNWFISFGLRMETSKMLLFFSRGNYHYGCYLAYSLCTSYKTRLNVYWRNMTRPELPWHSFGPVKDFDERIEAIYVFQRQEK
jgi:4-amino-4-deoxy-L-arabinose transferase-like glycosyltransferase